MREVWRATRTRRSATHAKAVKATTASRLQAARMRPSVHQLGARMTSMEAGEFRRMWKESG